MLFMLRVASMLYLCSICDVSGAVTALYLAPGLCMFCGAGCFASAACSRQWVALGRVAPCPGNAQQAGAAHCQVQEQLLVRTHMPTPTCLGQMLSARVCVCRRCLCACAARFSAWCPACWSSTYVFYSNFMGLSVVGTVYIFTPELCKNPKLQPLTAAIAAGGCTPFRMSQRLSMPEYDQVADVVTVF